MSLVNIATTLLGVIFVEATVAKTSEWNWPRQAEVTRCYKAESVDIVCEDYSYDEKVKQVLVQELEVNAIDSYGIRRKYSYGRAIEGPLCQKHLLKIQKLMKRADQVCVTASDEFPILGNNATYRWKALETKHGKLTW
jgi:hypothetical protein